MRIDMYCIIFACAVSVGVLTPGVWAKSARQKTIDDPFMVAPAGIMPNCDREQRFKYDVAINSVDDFIALLKVHQSNQELHGFHSTQESLIPGYTLQSVGKEENKRINLDDLKGNVQVFEVKKSTSANKKIFILQIWHKDYDENWPWQFLITASDQGHISVFYCAGI